MTRVEQIGPKLTVDSKRGVGVPWRGPASVDGRPWPVRDDKTVWLPPGPHAIEVSLKEVPARLTDFNGTLQSATATAQGFEFAYLSSSRALAKLDRTPRKLEIDGAETHPIFMDSTLVLPRGQHIITLTF